MSAGNSTNSLTERYFRVAVVTGANRGIGFEICRQLATKGGIQVVLTSRNEEKGREAVEKMRAFGLSDLVIFHQLDVTQRGSIASLAQFIKTRFGKLDILINNAGTLGVDGDVSTIKEYILAVPDETGEVQINPNEKVMESYELAVTCLQTDYYGTKRMVEAFVPLLQLSNSPRIVNMSSIWGMLKLLRNDWALSILSDDENLTEGKVDEVVNQFLKDFKEGNLKATNWPCSFPSCKVAKIALNAYSRVIAKKYPTININYVCPGHVQTDMSCYTGSLTAEQGAESPVKVALMPHGGPSGVFFVREQLSSHLDNYPIKYLT